MAFKITDSNGRDIEIIGSKRFDGQLALKVKYADTGFIDYLPLYEVKSNNMVEFVAILRKFGARIGE